MCQLLWLPRGAPIAPVVDKKLWEVKPPASLRNGVVIVSRPMCWNCKRFVARWNEVLGLEITVAACTVV